MLYVSTSRCEFCHCEAPLGAVATCPAEAPKERRGIHLPYHQLSSNISIVCWIAAGAKAPSR